MCMCMKLNASGRILAVDVSWRIQIAIDDFGTMGFECPGGIGTRSGRRLRCIGHTRTCTTTNSALRSAHLSCESSGHSPAPLPWTTRCGHPQFAGNDADTRWRYNWFGTRGPHKALYVHLQPHGIWQLHGLSSKYTPSINTQKNVMHFISLIPYSNQLHYKCLYTRTSVYTLTGLAIAYSRALIPTHRRRDALHMPCIYTSSYTTCDEYKVLTISSITHTPKAAIQHPVCFVACVASAHIHKHTLIWISSLILFFFPSPLWLLCCGRRGRCTSICFVPIAAV